MDGRAAVLRLADTLLPGGATASPPSRPRRPGSCCCTACPARCPPQLLAALQARNTPHHPADWVGAAARIEAVEPGLFAEFRKQAYLAYYEQPAVIAAIRALGHPYNDAPLPEGYPTAPFDPALDTPRHGR